MPTVPTNGSKAVAPPGAGADDAAGRTWTVERFLIVDSRSWLQTHIGLTGIRMERVVRGCYQRMACLHFSCRFHRLGKPRVLQDYQKGRSATPFLTHAHAIQLLTGNVNPMMVSERLGHNNIASNMVTYSHRTCDYADTLLQRDGPGDREKASLPPPS